jgi:hypothetical protein
MKPLTQNRNTFLSINNYLQTTPLQWKRLNDYLKASGCWLVAFWSAQLSLGESITVSTVRTPLNQVAAVVKAVRDGLTAQVLSLKTNRRLLVGFGFIGIMAPLVGCLHLLFDKSVMDREWYHLNNHYLLLLLGPFITGVFICIGVYHLFPNGCKRAYTLALPMGYLLGKIIWLYQIESNEEFEQIPPISIILLGVLISAVILFLNEWLAWRWAHRTRAFDSRLDGLYQIVDEESISAEKFRSMFKTVYQQKKNFPKEY